MFPLELLQEVWIPLDMRICSSLMQHRVPWMNTADINLRKGSWGGMEFTRLSKQFPIPEFLTPEP